MSEPIDHEELALSRVITQYSESVKLLDYIKSVISQSADLETAWQAILNERWIDTAVGSQLDILGEIVGQPRVLIDATALFYFGYLGAVGAQSYGTVGDPSIGGRFKSLDEPTTGNRTLIDDEYRFFIRARIIKNSIIPTSDNMAEFLNFLFQTPVTYVYDEYTGGMSYGIFIGKLLTANDKVFIMNTDLIPKVAAVRVNYFEFDPDSNKGYLGVPTSKGYGSVYDPNVGGKYASVIS